MSFHASASPSGNALAYVEQNILYTQELTRGQPPLPCSSISNGTSSTTARPAKILAVKWSRNDSRIAVVLEQTIRIFDSETRRPQATVRNGSSGFGAFAAAEFLTDDRLLVMWEFGTAKVWDLMEVDNTFDLPDVKLVGSGITCSLRPIKQQDSTDALVLAMLTKVAGDDHLILHFSPKNSLLSFGKLPTIDAQSFAWSCDGRWLAVLDSPAQNKNLHIYTADGCLFRSCSASKSFSDGLGWQRIAWSPNNDYLAAADHDGKVTLLRIGSFAVYTVLEHHTTIQQDALPISQQATVWQEHASSTNVRTYTSLSSPISPPLSRVKPSADPKDLGIAAIAWNNNSTGSLLATSDTRMLNTVWIWAMQTMALHAVLVQHNDVRSIQWHPTLPATLLITSVEEIIYTFDAHAASPPFPIYTQLRPSASSSWLPTPPDSEPLILAAEKTQYRILTLTGTFVDQTHSLPPRAQRRPTSNRSSHSLSANPTPTSNLDDENEGDDSLFDLLSGRKPLHPKTEPSYTEMLDLEVARAELDGHEELEDTFRGKWRNELSALDGREEGKGKKEERDPLDDSQIF